MAKLAYQYSVSPQFECQFEHSKQGIIDLYRLNSTVMTINRNGEGAMDVHVERMIVMNSFNSCKIVTRIKGTKELGSVTLPKGGTVSVDEEVLKWSLAQFEQNDKNVKFLAKEVKKGKR